MSLSTPFIHRPVATTLLTIAVALAGGLAFFLLPVSPLPQVDFPSVSVSASLPGGSPETMASSVATPLERQFGRIAGVTEMTSSSTLGSSNITLVFDLDRNIDAAARDVQAAINAAGGYLPANLPSKPTYRKVNPADAPIMILTMTSDLYGKPQMYDAASSILAQKLSQVDGVGQVSVGGSALPAVRVDVNPTALNDAGLGLQDVKATLSAANINGPKGQLMGERTRRPAGHRPGHDRPTVQGRAVQAASDRLPERVGRAGGRRGDRHRRRGGRPPGRAVRRQVRPQGDDRRPRGRAADHLPPAGGEHHRHRRPHQRAAPATPGRHPAGMHLGVGMDRTTTIRASVKDVEFTLLVSIALVILVVFVFLRDVRATLIPSVAVPVSLIGTFAVMYLCGYSLDNLSLMALTIATGFVVDDAIVVLENISRHLEDGLQPVAAAVRGASEIGFTVLSISVSLVAVFIPILLMGGYIGRLFREFAVVLSVAIGVSMVVSLTTTPMMCAALLRPTHDAATGGCTGPARPCSTACSPATSGA